HLGDQWVLPLALAVWRSGRAAAYTCSELTAHALTHFRVIERFLPVRITQEPADGGGGDGRGGGTAAIRIRVEPSR
ncbi:MAG TPA: RNA 3'-terminal phosphate cyclase, partial [Burkholderiaceae bacterium]|nr:RNA 3'-terminal phosphate cyclase [Burkholderiaceae bacterium]